MSLDRQQNKSLVGKQALQLPTGNTQLITKSHAALTDYSPPMKVLEYCLLCRNVYRNTAQMYALDDAALVLAKNIHVSLSPE